MSITSNFPDMLFSGDNNMLHLMSYCPGSKVEGSVQRMYDIIDTAFPLVIKDVISMPLISQDLIKLQNLLNTYPMTNKLPFDSTASSFFINNYQSILNTDNKLQTMNNQYFIYYVELRNLIAAGILSLQQYSDSIYAYIFNFYSDQYNNAKKVNGNPSPDYVGMNNNIPSDVITIANKIDSTPYGGFDYSTIDNLIANLSYEYGLIEAYIELKDPSSAQDIAMQNLVNSIDNPISNIYLLFNNPVYGIYVSQTPATDFEVSGSLKTFQNLINNYNTNIQDKITVLPGTRTVDFSAINVTEITSIVSSIINQYNIIMRKVSFFYDIKQFEYVNGVTKILVKKTFKEKILNWRY